MKKLFSILLLSVMTLCAGVTFACDTGHKQVPKITCSIEKATTVESLNIATLDVFQDVGCYSVASQDIYSYSHVAFASAEIKCPDPEYNWCNRISILQKSESTQPGYVNQLYKPGTKR